MVTKKGTPVKKTKDVLTVKKVNMYLETLKAKSTEYHKIYSAEVLYITQVQIA